ncbi:MAG TPA: hypothetical protein VHV78_09860, partial [Gemmatimonadaceae bacterium]|nr:hypothetical protein [Gemmatimonadaceae bacterium]
DGTTGYDFMNLISAVQHDPSSDAAFTRLWTDVSGRPPDFEMEERAARRDMLSTAFANALRVAAAAFAPLGNDGDAGNDVAAIQCAISLTIERFRAYRTYAVGDSREPAPGALFEDAVCSAAADAAGPVRRALDLVASVVRGDAASGGGDARDAVRRFNQLAAPIAAKAVEDTACYRYGRLLSRNDVGFSPGRFSMSVAEFHRHNAAQADAFPRTLVTTATHDHKRGEDARARLAALSELPAEWAHAVDAWFAMNAPRRPAGIGRGDEYQLYQTLIGAWPVELAASDADGLAAFEERILAWRVKSLREAKLETSWDRPNGAFENAHKAFVGSLLAPSQPFVEGLASFVARLAPAGALNSLAACALRCTSPGVPDLYQGDEAWDLTLVDPDNRRPVDFDRRRALLSAGGARDLPELLGEWSSGAVKATLIARLLALRARVPSVFLSGAYVPIETSSERILAFARTDETAVVLVAVPRLCANDAVVSATPLPAPGQHRWRDLSLPSAWRHREWRDVLSRDAPVVARADGDAIFDRFPAVVLLSA